MLKMTRQSIFDNVYNKLLNPRRLHDFMSHEDASRPHSPTVFGGIIDYMAESNETSATSLQDEQTLVLYDHYNSYAYKNWTTMFRIVCMITICVESIMAAFNILLLLVSHIESFNSWKFVQELLQAILSISGIMFCSIAIYSTWKTTHRDKRKTLAKISLVGIFICTCFQLFMVFFPFMTGIETAPSIFLDVWNQKTRLTVEFIFVPLTMTLVLGFLLVCGGTCRLYVMITYDRRAAAGSITND